MIVRGWTWSMTKFPLIFNNDGNSLVKYAPGCGVWSSRSGEHVLCDIAQSSKAGQQTPQATPATLTDLHRKSRTRICSEIDLNMKMSRDWPQHWDGRGLFWYQDLFKSRVSCQKSPICHAWAWRVGPFWQDTIVFRYRYSHRMRHDYVYGKGEYSITCQE